MRAVGPVFSGFPVEPEKRVPIPAPDGPVETTTDDGSGTTKSTTLSTEPSGTNPAGYPTPPPYPEAGSSDFPIDDEIDDSL